MLSALFILAANSWMQHPVGYTLNQRRSAGAEQHRALFTNPMFLWGFVHVLLASLVTGSLVMLAVSAWYLRGHREVEAFRRTATVSLVVLLPAIMLAAVRRHRAGRRSRPYQPMKIAAAEAQWTNCQPCSFSAFQIGGGNNDQTPDADHPHPAPALAARDQHVERQGGGAEPAAGRIRKKYGPGNYVPDVFIQYWSMRVMAYLASLIAAVGAVGRVARYTVGRLDRSKWFLRAALWAVVTPFLMNTAGWLLTENGRQPWIVQGLMKTVNASSPSVTATDIWISLVVFVLIYLALGAADLC